MRHILFLIAVLFTTTLLVHGAPTPPTGDQIYGTPPTTAASNEILIYYKGQEQPDHVKYGQCIPFKKNGQAVRMANFPTLVTCYGYSDAACQKLVPLVPAPFLSQVRYANFLELGSITWGSYNCYNMDNNPLTANVLHNDGGSSKPIV